MYMHMQHIMELRCTKYNYNVLLRYMFVLAHPPSRQYSVENGHLQLTKFNAHGCKSYVKQGGGTACKQMISNRTMEKPMQNHEISLQ